MIFKPKSKTVGTNATRVFKIGDFLSKNSISNIEQQMMMSKNYISPLDIIITFIVLRLNLLQSFIQTRSQQPDFQKKNAHYYILIPQPIYWYIHSVLVARHGVATMSD